MGTIIVSFHSSGMLSSPKFVLPVHKLYSVVYSLHTLLVLDVFHQFQPPCYFLNFSLPFLHKEGEKFYAVEIWSVSIFVCICVVHGSWFIVLTQYIEAM